MFRGHRETIWPGRNRWIGQQRGRSVVPVVQWVNPGARTCQAQTSRDGWRERLRTGTSRGLNYREDGGADRLRKSVPSVYNTGLIGRQSAIRSATSRARHHYWHLAPCVSPYLLGRRLVVAIDLGT